MSAQKRKQETSKKASDSAKKRIKLESKPNTIKSERTTSNPVQTSIKPSLLSKEPAVFPRGGAGPLTLLEQKQIRAKASRDVAKETNGDLFTEGDHGDTSDDSELDLGDLDKSIALVKKDKKSKKGVNTAKKSTNEDQIHIESVSHKKLAEGSLLLGRVKDIGLKDIVVALPNGLVGHVQPTAISAQFNVKLEKSLNEADESEDDEAQDGLNDLDLAKHFRKGQMLRVAYLEPESAPSGKQGSRKRINLSLHPRLVNKGITRTDLAHGVSIQGSVTSVEDHGAILDTGLDDGTTGFISKDALPQGLSLQDVQVGSVLLCSVSEPKQTGKTVQLSADLSSSGLVKSVASVDVMLPGTIVEVLLTQVTDDGLAGKVMGLLDVTADVVHSGRSSHPSEFSSKNSVGHKVKGRLIANFPLSDSKKLAFSALPQILTDTLTPQALEISSTVDQVEVIDVAPRLGVFVSLPGGEHGFVHISRLSDKNVETLLPKGGPFKIGSVHKARIVDYNQIDNLYGVSFQQSVLDQQYLRREDVRAGDVTKGTIEKVLIGEDGVRGLLVRIASGIVGFVPQLHLSDVTIKNPEKKFREGSSVTARVFSNNLATRKLTLTLKKTLLNSDLPVWAEYKDITVGSTSSGILVKIDPKGAVVQFFNGVKGYLPVSEMSEAFIKDAREHFKLGQVLTLHATTVDLEARKLNLSVREKSEHENSSAPAISIASFVSGQVIEKTADDLTLALKPSNARARLSQDHVCDGSEKKRKSVFEKVRVGQKLEDLLVLNIQQRGRLIELCNKQTIKQAAIEGKLLSRYEDLKEDATVTGFVSNITGDMVFVAFANGISGVIHKQHVPDSQLDEPDFGLKRLQAVTARVISVDYRGATPRFRLTMKASKISLAKSEQPVPVMDLVEPVDENLRTKSDITVGTVIKARIMSVKETQINVEIAKGVHGRVDVSEVFDQIEDIKDYKHPLKQFSNKQVLTVRVLGVHDSRSYKFLPISHRGSKNVVYELSAKPSVVVTGEHKVLALSDIQVGDVKMVFVNNIGDRGLFVNVSPAVRGQIKTRDVSDDLNLIANLPSNYPVGSVLKATVTAVNAEKNQLDLSAKTGSTARALTLDNVSRGDIVAGRITKITDRALIVQLSESLVGAVELVDIADDFSLADPSRFRKNEIVRAYVLQVDAPNKKIFLSTRPSKILSPSLEVQDPEVSSVEDVQVNDVRRGFVANVSDKGVFVTLGHGITALVRVTNLSDEYLKDWKNHIQVDQLVQGKIVLADRDSGHIQMSLKKSHVSGDYKAPVTFGDLSMGDVVEGKIAKIEPFGVFIVVDNSQNVRGLCHRSEIADQRVEDVTKLSFNEGDAVKAKVLKIDVASRKINFGMKASYFLDDDESDSEDEDVQMGDVGLESEQDEDDDDDDDDDENEGVDLTAEDEQSDQILSEDDNHDRTVNALSVGGFDWSGRSANSQPTADLAAESDSDAEQTQKAAKKKKKTRAAIQQDLTGDLDPTNPQTPDDFDRLLLPDSANATLWLRYIAYYLDLGDLPTARSTAERAISSIPASHTPAKLTLWTALLNLENTHGTPETLQSTLARASSVLDPEEIYSRLASILIQSGNHTAAREHFEAALKRFPHSPALYLNYATFLFDTLTPQPDPVAARALLPRALASLPTHTHLDTTRAFAQLEFKTRSGVPEEARTRFQGLFNLYPKRLDLFHVLLDLEISLLRKLATTNNSTSKVEIEEIKAQKHQIRNLFGQALQTPTLKPVKSKPFFEKWLRFEDEFGDERSKDDVTSRASKWVEEYTRRQQAKEKQKET